MIWSIAWKNVWRSKRRSLVVIIAVTIGTIAGVFTAGLMKGWVDQRIKSAIFTEVSHLQIHNKNYLINEELKYTVPHPDKLIQFLQNSPEVKAYSNRLKIMAMASTSLGNTGLKLQGVHLRDEEAVSDIYQKIQPDGGTFLQPDQKNRVVISDKTAEQLRIKTYTVTDEVLDSLNKLEVPPSAISILETIKGTRYNTKKLFQSKLEEILSKKDQNKFGRVITETSRHYRLRTKIVFTFTGEDGQMVYQAFRVCGIYKTTNTMFDQMNAYVRYDDLLDLAGFNSNVFHETAVILNNGNDLKQFKNALTDKFSDLSILDWKELAPDAGMLSQYMNFYYYIIMGFILFALAFGIINTMLMAILERLKELGMLLAIGMNKRKVFSMIMLETIFLTLVGAIAGMILGAVVIYITGRTGINLSSVGEGMEAMGWAAVIYPGIEWHFFFGITLMVILTAILSSVMPARKALKLKPADALRIDM
ncbi:ABC transporter permease [Saccharicrinis sp. FJH54]|uniref:ABC transporter permease n=1 Tax=Saccharicrinis sp. FJH54 TaxID=3344665 RepID=UPI0035D4C16F